MNQVHRQASPEDRIDIAIKSFDWLQCLSAVEELRQNPKKNASEILLERIKFSGRLVEQRPSTPSQAKKDDFKENALKFISEFGDHDSVVELKEYLAGILLVEEAYSGILDSLSKHPIQRLSEAEQIWAVINWMAECCDRISQELQKDLKNQKMVFDPINHQIKDPAGNLFRPDAVIPAVVDALSSTLLMFGYTKSWFNSDGILVIPKNVIVPPDGLSQAESLAVLAIGWGTLQSSEERWRFFGGNVSKCKAPTEDPDGNLSEIDSIRFDCAKDDFPLQILDVVANERLNRLIAQAFSDLHLETNWQKAVVSWKQRPKLPPKSYISDIEMHSVMSLTMALHIDVLSDTTLYEGLTLAEWIRCFSWLREYVIDRQSSNGSSLILFVSPSDLLNGLVDVGISKPAAIHFIRCATFNRSSADLFDSPLMLCSDGQYAICAAQLTKTNFPRAILSLLASMEISFRKKGVGLEREVQALFKNNGIPCKGFKYKVNGDEFEYDAVAIWDKTAFLFECKNRSLSGNKPSRRHSFLKELAEATSQVERLANALKDNPNFLKEQFGISEELKIIPCILNGLPFSMSGKRNGTFIYDFSSLSKFFEGPSISINMPANIEKNVTVMMRRHVLRVWKGIKPDAQDLIDQLESPWQLKSLSANYRFEYLPFAISDSLIGHSPFPRLQPPDIKRTLNSLGVKDVASEENFFASTQREVKKLRKRIKQSQTKQIK